MLVSEFKTLIDGKVTQEDSDKTVELIYNNKKYFISDFQSGMNTFSLEVTRKHYTPLKVTEFLSRVSEANIETNIKLLNIDDSKLLKIDDIYSGSRYIELLVSKSE